MSDGEGNPWNKTERILKSLTKLLEDVKSAIEGVPTFIAQLSEFKPETVIPILDSAISILNITENEIITNPFVKKIIKDQEELLSNRTANLLANWPELLLTFTNKFLELFDPETMTSFRYEQNRTSKFNPKQDDKEQKQCKKYVVLIESPKESFPNEF